MHFVNQPLLLVVVVVEADIAVLLVQPCLRRTDYELTMSGTNMAQNVVETLSESLFHDCSCFIGGYAHREKERDNRKQNVQQQRSAMCPCL